MRAVVAACDTGLLVLLGIAADDDETARTTAWRRRVARLRVFENDDGKLDLAVQTSAARALVVSQFTLIADTRRGTGPASQGRRAPRSRSRSTSASAALCEPRPAVATGGSARGWQVELVNDGPVTIVLGVEP